MKEGCCILYLYDQNYSMSKWNNKGKLFISVCDEETALHKAVEHKDGFARILSNSTNGNILLKEFINCELIFLEDVSRLLNT